MADPRDCHGAECAGCGGWFRDEDDVNDDMLCESCEADALSTAYDDALAAYHEADEAVAVAQADVADLPYLQRLTVLVPLYTDLLEAHAASEAARAAAAGFTLVPLSRKCLAEAEEEADRAEERRHAAQEAAADRLPDEWLAVAADITGAVR